MRGRPCRKAPGRGRRLSGRRRGGQTHAKKMARRGGRKPALRRPTGIGGNHGGKGRPDFCWDGGRGDNMNFSRAGARRAPGCQRRDRSSTDGSSGAKAGSATKTFDVSTKATASKTSRATTREEKDLQAPKARNPVNLHKGTGKLGTRRL